MTLVKIYVICFNFRLLDLTSTISNTLFMYSRIPNILPRVLEKWKEENDMTNQILLTGQAYRNFIETIHSPFSRVSCKNSMSLYMQFRKIQDCNQLIEEALKITQSQLIDYVISLREENKLNAATIKSRIAAVKKFYDTNNIELRRKLKKKIKSYIGKRRKEKKIGLIPVQK